MELNIIGPSSNKKFNIEWLEINTLKGNFLIQEGHIPMIITLKPSDIIFKKINNAKETMKINAAIVHVQRHKITILVTYE